MTIKLSDPSSKIGKIPVAMQELLKTYFEKLQPRAKIDLDEWSDKYRFLPESTSSEPGQWRTDRFPYLREIMKCLSPSSRARTIDVMKGAQLGFTELMICWMLYTWAEDPSPFMYLQRTDEDVQDFVDQKLQPSIDLCPVIHDEDSLRKSTSKKKQTSKKKMKSFPGGYIAMGSANSASTLRSKSLSRIAADEIDAYKKNVNEEGDPLLIISRRVANFPNSKQYRISTPTLKETSRIEPLYEAGDQRRYYVPCPHCNASADKSGTYFTIKWKNIVWEEGKPKTAKLICVDCGCEIDEAHKTWMLEQGEWRAENPFHANQMPGDVDIENVSFHINSLYSPLGFFSWADAATMFINAHKNKDNEQLKVFVNTVLGESWSETGKSISYEFIKKRKEPYSLDGSFEIPHGVYVLTAGADVQDDRIECEVLGHGINNETWSIEYKVFSGDTEQAQVWQEFDLFLLKQYRHQSGVMMNISGAAVDSGHRSKLVYAFCRDREYRRIYPVKGKGGWGQGNIKRPMRPHKDYGVWLITVWVDELKLSLYSRLRTEIPGPQYCHFPYSPEYTEEYFKQLTAETLVTRRVNGANVLAWDLSAGKRNEALDCRIYNLAILEFLNIDVMSLAMNNILLSNKQHAPAAKRKTRRKVHKSAIS